MYRLLVLAFLGVFSFLPAAFAQTATTFTPPAVVADMLKKPRTVLLDVRTPEEFAAGHVKGAENLNFRAPDFREQVAKLDKEQNYVLYCASGNRSGQTLKLMEEAGFKNVVNAGGFKDLKAAGLPSE
ncbi:rhodanese-like domain-containing protein [Hymenobacter sp. YC55]|uniref:rhodanese-like domain-containing protein n=1 Tax=Hymenobacter sp. YC55 TaxID=3034019 RepID=UPI0023F63921|nr:rhodanese-like domain-containing protein [Hymenobacter sp. YC55]MDF7811367.1 rhodanese-like domain-containing protein [Hymenobacter sp. YC55]